MDTNKDTKDAATSVATSTISTPGAVPVDASSLKGQQAFRKAQALTDGPSYCPEDDQQLPSSLEQESVSSSVATSTVGTPGAVSVDASSLKGQQAFRKAQALTDGPSYYPEDEQQLPSSLEQESVSSSVATITVGTPGAVPVAASSLKGQQALRKAQALTDGPSYYPEDHQQLQLPQSLEQESVSSKRAAGKSHYEKSEETNMTTRAAGEDTKQEADQDEYEEDETPGAFLVSGMNSMNSTGGDQEDDFTMADEDSKKFRTSKEGSSQMLIEAQLVVEEDTERLAEDEREKIQEDTRQKVLKEMGNVAQAEIVKDDGSKTRHRALIYISIILVGVILGSVLGTRKREQNTIISVFLFNNSICKDARPIFFGEDASLNASLEDATEQLIESCEFPFDSSVDSRPGLWFKFIGLGKPVIARAIGSVNLQVTLSCDTCNITNTSATEAISASSVLSYTISGDSSTVELTGESGVEYRLLVTSNSNTTSEFELRIVDNDFCGNAFGPITPRAGQFVNGSTSNGATIDTIETQSPSCGSAFSPTAPGVWYTIIGDGGVITASTCNGTDFDSQISVFTGSCSDLECVDGNDDAKCGKESLVSIQSKKDETYHVLVHGFNVSSGNFNLEITTEFCGSRMLETDGVPRKVLLEDTKLDAALPYLPRCFSFPDNNPAYGAGIWYRIVGTGNSMSVQLNSGVLLASGPRLSVFSGSGCSNFSCVVTNCFGTCDWESTAEETYYIYFTFVGVYSLSGYTFLFEEANLVVTAN